MRQELPCRRRASLLHSETPSWRKQTLKKQKTKNWVTKTWFKCVKPLKDTPQKKTCKWPKGRWSGYTSASSHPNSTSHYQNWWVINVASLWRKEKLTDCWQECESEQPLWKYKICLQGWKQNYLMVQQSYHRAQSQRDKITTIRQISASCVYIALFTNTKKLWDVQTDTYKTHAHTYFCIWTCTHISLHVTEWCLAGKEIPCHFQQWW